VAKRHLNTLYVTTDGAYLRKDGANIVVEVDSAERMRAPVHLIGGIVLFGRAAMSPALMGSCLADGVTITYLSEIGRFLARVEGPVAGNVLLRREQYRRLEDATSAASIARSIIAAKITNQRANLLRARRDHGATMSEASRHAIDDAENGLAMAIRRLADPTLALEVLRGIEGDAAARYFSVFGRLIRSPEPGFAFNGRSRRPPLDPLNALLSFAYTLLTHDCRSALEAVGLDPACGFLHALRPGRPSLALDLMEELRAPLADRFVLSLVNRGQVHSSSFRHMDNQAVFLTDDARKYVLIAWQERKKADLTHPFLNEETTIGLLPYVQAQLLARHLRGDLDAYPPMIWK
jgi:CRISPR-associated protein Cas1